MTYSLIGADRATHVRMLLVTVIAAAVIVTGIGVAARVNDRLVRSRLHDRDAGPTELLTIWRERPRMHTPSPAQPCPEPHDCRSRVAGIE